LNPNDPTAPAATQVQKDIAAALKRMGVKKKAAKSLITNFDAIRPSVRIRNLGKTFDAGTRAPATVRTRAMAQLNTALVDAPHVVLRGRLIDSGSVALPPGPPVLAPNDYTVIYEGLYCIDETGPDWWGSDETYVVTTAVHITPGGANVVRTERHPFLGDNTKDAYSDVDSEEVRVGPRAAIWNAPVAQVNGGVSITTVVFDRDLGDPDAYKDEVDAAVKLALSIAGYIWPPAKPILLLIAASGLVTDFFNWLIGTGDDKVGERSQVFELAELEDFSRTPNSNYQRPGRAATALKYDVLATVNDNDYAVAYTVTRNPAAPPYPPPIVT
jgi:hypothetical protein